MNNISSKSDFEMSVEKAEQLAQSNMSYYKFKLLLFALLGYFVIFAVLFTLFGLLGGMIGGAFYSTALLLILVKKKLLFILLPMIWILLKSLLVRFEAPVGYSLTRKKYPDLYAEIDKLRKKLKAPNIHQVILTPELNAAIYQTPRLGIFGCNKNTLILGLELLLTLSPEQAEAVLAHEFGHLSGNHSRFNGWIYRVRHSWFRIMGAFHNTNNLGASIMLKFFDWYAPKFAAYSFVLARLNEYEADSIAAELTNSNSTGRALVNTYVSGPYVEEHYWQLFFNKADTLPQPDHPPWAGLSGFLIKNEPAADQLAQRLQQELEAETSYNDTHPSLTDRLAALKIEAMVPEPCEKTAAEVWFGTQFAQVIEDFDNDWLQTNSARWKERYDYVVESKQNLSELQKKGNDSLKDDELWKKAMLTEEFESGEAACSILQTYQRRCPDDPEAAFVLGRLSFEKAGDELLKQMKIALERPNLVIDACQYAYHYLIKSNRNDEAEWWRKRAEQQLEMDEACERERAELTINDTIIPFAEDAETLSYIIDKLKRNKKVKKAWIAQKQMQYYPEIPAITIAFIDKGLSFSHEKLTQEIGSQLELNCSLYVLPKAGEYKKLAKKVIKYGDQII